MTLRWLLELKPVPALDETGFNYQLWLVDLTNVQKQPAVCVTTVDELFDALFAAQHNHLSTEHIEVQPLTGDSPPQR